MESMAYLIQDNYDQDKIGQFITKEPKKHEIYCHEGSIKHNEFYKAGQKGLSADLVLVTQSVNYNKEKLLEYEGDQYRIYRSYRVPNSDEIELYCEINR